MLRPRLVASGLAAALLAIVVLTGWPARAAETPAAAAPAPPLTGPGPEQPPATAAEGMQRFAADLYRAIAAGDGNRCCSPASIHAALAMTALGARGATLDEIAATCGFPAGDGIHAAWKELAQQLTPTRWGDGQSAYEWALANALFVQRTYPLEAAFVDGCRADYEAAVENVDFHGAAPAAIATINHWAAAKTAGKIPAIVWPESVTADTRVVLVDAVRVQARWAQPFDPAATRDEPFHRADGDASPVPTMHAEAIADLGRIADAQVLRLAYQSAALDLVLVVPDAVDGLPAIERRLDAATLAAICAAPTQEGEVSVALPRFRFDTGMLALGETLRGLGIRRAFSDEDADLSGISREPGFHLGEVVQRAFVAVDENGTEAAAVTAEAMVGLGLPPERIGAVACDRPFLALIRHVRTGTILFMIRVADPRG